MLTLAEMAIRANDPLEKGIIRLYAEHSDILTGLPFKSIGGNAYTKKREKTLSGVGHRSVNEEYADSTGTQERISEDLKIMGGKALVDRFIIKTAGPDSNPVAEEVESKVKAASMFFNKTFIKGDGTADTESFDGLENRLTGAQVLDMGDTVGGDALTLNALDELIDTVGSPSQLIMNTWTRRKINQLMRASGQAFEYVKNDFGKLIPYYGGIPVALVGVDNTFSEIMAFDEDDNTDEAALCTSIYAVKYGADALHGIQHSSIIVDDQGIIGNSRQIVFDWYVSFIINQPKAAARLRGIKKV
ncbi:major capsid protein [Desulfobacula sp.]|uniref:major capsid protein n=1 Tax=Desulfobacula sp. TaxID=2593537 RepID=UPI002619F457|nr:hypothetical protein [Desulfobacula sp.]